MDLTVRDAAQMLAVTEDTIYDWIRDKELPAYQIGDKCRLNRVELLEWASTRNIKVAPAYFHPNGAKAPNLLLTDAIRLGGIIYDLSCNDKASALKAVCDTMPLPQNVNREELHSVLVAREALWSTGIGNGVAIPHPRGPIVLGVSKPQVTVAFPKQPIDYAAIDNKLVNVLFVIVSTTVRVHLLLLSRLMFALQDETFRKRLDSRAPQDVMLDHLETIEAEVAKSDPRRNPRP